MFVVQVICFKNDIKPVELPTSNIVIIYATLILYTISLSPSRVVTIFKGTCITSV